MSAGRLFRSGLTPFVGCRRCISQVALATRASSSTSPARKFKLILYSKDGCHLCTGLKEKVAAVLAKAQFMPSALTGVQLEVRDITSNREWEDAYSLSIPVLTRADMNGRNEVKIARSPPRISAERLAAHLEAAMQDG